MRSMTIRGRFAITAIASLLRSLLSFLTGIMLARGLGPENYGILLFLLGISLALRQLLDLGTSSAFFTFLSQRQRSRRFVELYFLWLVLQIGLPVVAILYLLPDSWVGSIWHLDSRHLVAMALLASFLQNGVWPTILQMGESQRATWKFQVLGLCLAATTFLSVVVLWYWSILGLILVLLTLIVEYLAAAWIAMSNLRFVGEDDQDESLKVVLAKYGKYCAPMIPYGWIGFAYSFADVWLLQRFGGSVEQAYYGLSLQIASASVIVAASIQNVFWKEIAEASHMGDMRRTAYLYRRVSRATYFASALFAGLAIPWTEEILLLAAGPQYAHGAVVLAILCVYPVQQSMAHVETTMLMATERTKTQVHIGIWFMLISIIVTYLMLAPTNEAVPGLGLASTGLAVKMVVMVTLQVIVMAVVNSKFLNVVIDFRHRIVSLIVAVSTGWLSAQLAKVLFFDLGIGLCILIPAASLYVLFTVLILYAMPWLVDASRQELKAWAYEILVSRR